MTHGAVFELLMSLYHVPFDHIAERWTDEQVMLIMEKAGERGEQERRAQERAAQGKKEPRQVSGEEFMRIVNRGN